METWLIHTLNGVSFGMQLFLIAAGLSLIFGMMRILNLAHGSFYILGAYIAISVFGQVGNFWLALLAGALALAVLGVLMQRFLMHRFIHDEMGQILLTFGFLFIIQDFTLWIWGGNPLSIPEPTLFDGSVNLGFIDKYPLYRLFLIGVGLAIAVGLGLLQERTKMYLSPFSAWGPSWLPWEASWGPPLPAWALGPTFVFWSSLSPWSLSGDWEACAGPWWGHLL